jgi:AraC-like DNA-binding protein
MLDLNILQIGVFTWPLENDYTTPAPTISFFAVPPRLMECDGQRITHDGPSLFLAPAGARLRLKCVGRRRNWAAVIDSDDIRASDQPGQVELRSLGVWHRAPMWIPVEAAFVTHLEHEWQEMRDAFLEGLPGSRLSARIGIANQVRLLLDYRRPHSDHTPAARLKRLIDEDEQYSRNLDDLSSQCGFSSDHMRLLFKEAYGAAPNQYRNQRRMAVGMDLIAHSDLSIKEIGVHIGCRHMSHFSSLFRKEFDMSPRDAVTGFRY